MVMGKIFFVICLQVFFATTYTGEQSAGRSFLGYLPKPPGLHLTEDLDGKQVFVSGYTLEVLAAQKLKASSASTSDQTQLLEPFEELIERVLEEGRSFIDAFSVDLFETDKDTQFSDTPPEVLVGDAPGSVKKQRTSKKNISGSRADESHPKIKIPVDAIIDVDGKYLSLKGIKADPFRDFFKKTQEVKSEHVLYKCNQCPLVTTKSNLVRQHLVRQAHPPINQGYCGVCAQGFAQIKNLQDHFRSEGHKDKLRAQGINEESVNDEFALLRARLKEMNKGSEE